MLYAHCSCVLLSLDVASLITSAVVQAGSSLSDPSHLSACHTHHIIDNDLPLSPADVSSTIPTSAAVMIPSLIDLLQSGALNEHLGRKGWKEMFSSLVALPTKLLLSTGGGRWSSSECWKKLAAELLRAKKADHTRSLPPSPPLPSPCFVSHLSPLLIHLLLPI